VVLFFVALAIAPALVATHDPDAQDPANSLQSSSRDHLFGTDNFGRDVFSRVVHGARTSLYIGFGAVIVGLGLATAIGRLPRYAGGWWYSVIHPTVCPADAPSLPGVAGSDGFPRVRDVQGAAA
jgi:peptide/nickel transport system permease protein